MKFTKMHGLGNDFVVLDGFRELPANASELAIAWCDRHFGIGADGLVFVLPSERADFMMRIVNSDGTEAEQCGNAIRCVAKFVRDRGLKDADEIAIETIGAGVQRVRLTIEDGRTVAVRVDMGEPILDGLAVPTTIERSPVVDYPVAVEEAEFRFTAVSMGNPHCVIFVDDAPTFDLRRYGPPLETHELFPRKINVEFATVRNRHYADMRVWERGAGPTLACGTGACATLVAGVLTGKLDRSATVSLAGGELDIEWDAADNRVYMTGPAEFVFDGVID